MLVRGIEADMSEVWISVDCLDVSMQPIALTAES